MRTVTICSRERLFRDGIEALFSANQFMVASTHAECRDCIQAAKEQACNLMVLDLLGISNNDLQFVLGALAFGDFRCILISSHNRAPEGFEAVVDRSQTADDLLGVARDLIGATAGPVSRGRGRPRMITAGFELSRREYEAGQLIAKGCTNEAIAREMDLKEQSVKNLVSTVIRKLRCENRVQVALRLASTLKE
ncbi:MAG TPA: LuxR C-terminal-related transcriptional regulator [Fimbriimonadaceae bacterium]|nr:LuxR C-terminal-related transcriptional regulator [Fimbriimonadaceae bacterium]